METGTPKTDVTAPKKLAQRPNKPIVLAFVSLVVYIVSSRWSWLADGAFTVFVLSLTFWATWEITDGANLFRRLLGAIALIVVAVSLFEKLHA